MKEPKECEKLLELTDSMIHVQGVILIEQGLKLLSWSKSKCEFSEEVSEKLNHAKCQIQSDKIKSLIYNDITSNYAIKE